jgi:hypothetical protein
MRAMKKLGVISGFQNGGVLNKWSKNWFFDINSTRRCPRTPRWPPKIKLSYF